MWKDPENKNNCNHLYTKLEQAENELKSIEEEFAEAKKLLAKKNDTTSDLHDKIMRLTKLRKQFISSQQPQDLTDLNNDIKKTQKEIEENNKLLKQLSPKVKNLSDTNKKKVMEIAALKEQISKCSSEDKLANV